MVSAATEALYAIGRGHRVIGCSRYCGRYIRDLNKPVAGDYLRIDKQRFAELDPDLVLVTTGLQRKLGLKLANRGLPVYALPLPNSFYGIIENNVVLGALLNEIRAGRELSLRMEAEAAALRPLIRWLGPGFMWNSGLDGICARSEDSLTSTI